MDRDVDALSAFYHEDTSVPPYLLRHYWWAYVHPRGVKIFDRGWLINLILLGNYKRLVCAALAEFETAPLGRLLQLACVYGNLTPKLAKRASEAGGTLDVIDVLPIQLRNLKWKLPSRTPARLLRMDSTALEMPDARYDTVLLFFLLHEQPEAVRQKTVAEALRVLKPGGKLILVDYGKAAWWNPLRYLMAPFLAVLEPFTLSLIATPLAARLPSTMTLRQTSYFGGFYQKLVAIKRH
ncbi:MAG: rhodoquinone biosynthesis methyltransferase RquA [Rhizomicrobium sp.]|nr:rhodoquinone biosynthesis methyltransferase RquA [Rhizomicrobium sp.]